MSKLIARPCVSVVLVLVPAATPVDKSVISLAIVRLRTPRQRFEAVVVTEAIGADMR